MPDLLNNLLRGIAEGLARPIQELLFDGGSRYFCLSIVTGLLIAFFVYARRKQTKTFVELLTSEDVWLGRSAVNDYIILVVGSLLRFTLLSWAFLNWQDIARWMVLTLQSWGVEGKVQDGPALGLGLLLTLTLFAADDFLRWLQHYLMHRVPELWEFHKVHHSAEVLNFATVERFHPVDVVLSTLFSTLGFGVVNGVFIALYGNMLTPQSVLGANVFIVVFNLAGGVLRHSPFWIGFGSRVEAWVISPAMHQIHHSNRPEHFDRNLGSSLAIWDRLFGTHCQSDGVHIDGYGIGPETSEFRSLGVIYLRPFTRAARAFVRRFG